MTALIVAVAGALFAGGLVTLIYGLIPQPQRPPAPRRTRQSLRWRLSRRSQVLLGVGLAVGVLVAASTGWLIAVAVIPAAAAGLPVLLGRSGGQQAISRLVAMEEWSRSLSGMLTVGVGLEQALISSLRTTPEAIRPEITRLAGRLRARWRTRDALTALADDLGDPTGDIIAAALITATRNRGPGLARVLHEMAESVADDVRARQEIESDRAKPRGNARTITLVSLGFFTFMAFTDYVEPYKTPVGQVLLACLLSMYAATLVWLRVMAATKPMPRFMGAAAREQSPA